MKRIGGNGLFALIIICLTARVVHAQKEPIFHFQQPANSAERVASDVDVYTITGYLETDALITRIVLTEGNEVAQSAEQPGKDIGAHPSTSVVVPEQNPVSHTKKFTFRVRLDGFGPHLFHIRAFTATAQPASTSIEIVRSRPAGIPFYHKLHVLLIGIGDYKGLPASQRLAAPAQDINEWKRVLTQRYGIPEEDILTLVDRQATHANIDSVLRRLMEPDAFDTDDGLLIVYSGHGAVISDHTYLVPVDATWQPDSTLRTDECLGLEYVRSVLLMLRAKHVLFIADTCYGGSSGQNTDSFSATSGGSGQVIERAEHWARLVWAANANDTRAFEDPNTRLSYLTQAILSLLSTPAPLQGNESIWTVTDLQDRVASDVVARQAEQRPQVYVLARATPQAPAGDFVFSQAGRARSSSYICGVQVSDLPDSFLDKLGYKDTKTGFIVCHVAGAKLDLRPLDLVQLEQNHGDATGVYSLTVRSPFGRLRRPGIKLSAAEKSGPFEHTVAITGHIVSGFSGSFCGLVDIRRARLAAYLTGNQRDLTKEHVKSQFELGWDPVTGQLDDRVTMSVSSMFGTNRVKVRLVGNAHEDKPGRGRYASTFASGDWATDSVDDSGRFGLPLKVFRFSVLNP